MTIPAASSTQPTIAIIGAGFSGICAYIQLEKQLGIKSNLFELNSDVGGTWLQNTYPGCECDVPSHLYSLSSDLNPNWTNTFASQKEILGYLQAVCKKHDIYSQTRFETEVIRVTWINEENKWHVIVKNVNRPTEIEVLHFDIVFSAIGSLRVPKIPKEFASFEGPVVHTAQWDSSLELQGKRVALVGSGSSGVQILPYLAKEASEVYVYQRSAPWIFPKRNNIISLLAKSLFLWLPFLMILYRWFLILYYERHYINLGYPNSYTAKRTSRQAMQHNQTLLKELERPDLIDKLMPTSLNGCRRGVQSSDYYVTLAQPHVYLISDPIDKVKGNKVGDQQVDMVVLATGFETQEKMLGKIEIIGREGEPLNWMNHAPQLFKSTMIHGFPNFFMLLGPYSLTGHISIILMAEIQINYAIQCIKHAKAEPKLSSQEAYMAQLQKDFVGTAWQSSCSSWYKNSRGMITSLYPNSYTRFRWELQWDVNDFE